MSLTIITGFHNIPYKIPKHILRRDSFRNARNYRYIRLVGENESEIEILWDSPPMKTLLQPLNQIQDFLELQEQEEAFQNYIKEKYSLELDGDSLNFWETIYGL